VAAKGSPRHGLDSRPRNKPLQTLWQLALTPPLDRVTVLIGG
jgi:hypothetical protein